MTAARIEQLEAENKALREENKRLRALEVIVAEQAKLIEQLRERIAVLEKNSRTSSKPPSSDITKPKSEQKQKGKRKRGGQKGRRGSTRKRLPPELIDQRTEHDISSCPDCAGALSRSVSSTQTHQSIELVEKPTLATEHTLKGRYCPCCDSIKFPALPESVIPGHLFGPRLQAAICYLKGAMGISYTELQRLCKELFGVDASTGMLCDVVKRGSEALEEPYCEVWDAARSAARLHADETGWKDSGVPYWVWVFCNEHFSLFALRDTRAGRVLKEILGETFEGVLISDFFSIYPSFLEERLQLCLAHLIRDIKFLTTLPDKQTKRFSSKILRSFRSIFKLWHQREEIPREQFLKRMRYRMTYLYNYVWRARLKKGKAKTLQRRILKRWKCLFRFVEQPELYTPTNNHAEQQMRHLVRIRRQTQGTRSWEGQRWIERASTIIETCKKQNRSVFSFFLAAIRAKYSFRYPVPRMFPA